MIIDKIANLPLYESLIPGARQIQEAFLKGNPQGAAVEVREKSYAQKEDEKRRFEVHFATIDLMMAIRGEEVIHLCPMEELEMAEALLGGADGRKLNGGPKGSALLLKEGFFLLILPGEAHMVGGIVPSGRGEIEKWVVKVPSPKAFCIPEPKDGGAL